MDGICPIANPQSCCQVVVEHLTQLVPPAKFNPDNPNEFPVTHFIVIDTAIEEVCPEKVTICGVVRKTIVYTAVLQDGTEVENFKKEDDIPFQCFIDRDDANVGDAFEIVGKTVLCTVFARPANFGIQTNPVTGAEIVVAWKFIEKEILKICIRKSIKHCKKEPHKVECCSDLS
ncbi:hypothetical protein RB620_26080 [Paenibacillus sp. LHD-117]|uniref:hypothetical protein n=1 Tax=Paenibacillus sp. LHD-117 TaxID=3071412 RepID=UPI0027DF8C3D|nr:hypothetical protein [Paenibacillus sp. LHD-117]MDQ6422901.1 hypothetical protein [Paenibacillus sp. LHD-117]